MARAVDFEHGIGRKELQLIRRRFRGLQRERLRRIEADLSASQRNFITLLPLLLHINHPVLPGFTGSDTPAGISDYSPSQAVLRNARKLGRSFSYKKRARRRFHIHGLYLMGSIGSIAHTSGSDFDVWLCHDEQLASEELQALRAKTHKLEQWADELGLEVHIFIMDVKRFGQGDREAISCESSGTTQQHLLLEEFYRTGILLAGRHPLWWLVPPEQENNYAEYAAMLLHKRFVDPLDCLDFGGLEQTPADEFFGAARWQLYKGIESPYKSVLKLLLVEAYSRDYPHVRWLCQEAKASIYGGKLKQDELDPYLLMYRRVEQYLLGRNQPARLELARRCFYFKAEQPLSRRSRSKKYAWQRELLQSLVEEWGWDRSKLINLDSREAWKIDRVLEERNILVQELTHGYHILTEFSRTYAASGQIDPNELSLLGRKLFTALERQPGKIDHINPGISRNLVEKYLSLHHTQTAGGIDGWLLFCGEVNEQAVESAMPVKKTVSLIEMLSWIQVNALADRSTVVALFPDTCSVTPKELHQLLDGLRNSYPASQPGSVPLTALSDRPYADSCTLFINTGLDPMAHLSQAGKQLTSDRSDPLSFGSRHSCLVHTLEQLLVTSWGETLIMRHRSTSGLAKSLCHYLQLTLHNRPEIKAPQVVAFGFSSIRATAIAHRVAQLFSDVCSSFSPEEAGPESRYLFQADDYFYLVQKNRDGFTYFTVETQDELIQLLGEYQPRFRPLVIDQHALQETPLPTILQQNREGTIQLYYFNQRGKTTLYVLDELGALFHQNISGGSERQLLAQQQRFLNDLLMTRSLRTDQTGLCQLLDAPAFFHLSKDRRGNWKTEARTPPRTHITDDYMELRLITEGLELHQSPHMLVCDNQEFSSLEYGDDLFRVVARHIIAHRSQNRNYPIYITGLGFSSSSLEQNWSTIELLNFKKRLETRLNAEASRS